MKWLQNWIRGCFLKSPEIPTKIHHYHHLPNQDIIWLARQIFREAEARSKHPKPSKAENMSEAQFIEVLKAADIAKHGELDHRGIFIKPKRRK